MLTSERTIAPQNAAPNPFKKNPGTSLLVIMSKSALITKVNSPSVRILIGNVRMISIGFTNSDNNPHTMEITISGCQPAIVNPGTIYEVT